MEAIKVDDIVWFQAYKKNKPVQGRVKRIGTQVELGMGWRTDDNRMFYELETVGLVRDVIFTRTTIKWIKKIKQYYKNPDIY